MNILTGPGPIFSRSSLAEAADATPSNSRGPVPPPSIPFHDFPTQREYHRIAYSGLLLRGCPNVPLIDSTRGSGTPTRQVNGSMREVVGFQSPGLGLLEAHPVYYWTIDVNSFQVTLQSYSSSEKRVTMRNMQMQIFPDSSCASWFPRLLSVFFGTALERLSRSHTLPPSFPPLTPLAPLFVLRDGCDRFIPPDKHIGKTADAADEQEPR